MHIKPHSERSHWRPVFSSQQNSSWYQKLFVTACTAGAGGQLTPNCPTQQSAKGFGSRCPGGHLSTWQMTAASCLTALGALYGQLASRLAWYHEHTAAMATELLQLLDVVCGTVYWSSCAIQISPTDCLGDSWKDAFLGTMDMVLCDFWYVVSILIHLSILPRVSFVHAPWFFKRLGATQAIYLLTY